MRRRNGVPPLPALACVLGLWAGCSEADPTAIPDVHQVVVPGGALTGHNKGNSMARLRDGTIVLVWRDGFTHGSPPTPVQHPRLWNYIYGAPDAEDGWHAGPPHMPKGGAVAWSTSSDQGRSWSEPRVIVDTDANDNDPHVFALADDTLLLVFNMDVSYDYHESVHPPPYSQFSPGWSAVSSGGLSRSTDRGASWEPVRLFDRGGVLFQGPESLAQPTLIPTGPYGMDNGSGLVELPSGELLLLATHHEAGKARSMGIVWASPDRGLSWKPRSVLFRTDGQGLYEPGLCRTAEGRLLAVFRPNQYKLFESTDEGRHWSLRGEIEGTHGKPRGEYSALMTLRDGRVVLLNQNKFESGTHPSVTWTRDLKRWYGPFAVGRGSNPKLRAVELPDGSLLCTWHSETTRRQAEIRAARVFLRENGVDVTLP